MNYEFWVDLNLGRTFSLCMCEYYIIFYCFEKEKQELQEMQHLWTDLAIKRYSLAYFPCKKYETTEHNK